MSEPTREQAHYLNERAMHRSHVAPVPRFAHAVAALADERDRARDLLSEAVRMIEGYKRAGYLTNPAACEQADDFIGRSK